MTRIAFQNAQLVLPDRVVPRGGLIAEGGRIVACGADVNHTDAVDLQGKWLAPGSVELHVHGGAGADFMDLTEEAFCTVARCHARHGTTTITPTSTVGRRSQYRKFLELCQHFLTHETGGARLVGGHLYGPYFFRDARGCHPDAEFLTPDPEADEELLTFAGNGLVTLTVAPELPGSEHLIRRARERGLLVTAGHSYATFPQIEEAIRWGVSHVDHLFCAMSDRARLRQTQGFPMRGGVLEATLCFDELTTEVIPDGKHLTGDLLRLAYKSKGPDRLALVTDSMRAVDCPDGEYWFGAEGDGVLVRRLDDVGVTLDAKALASSVMGMDHCIRTFHQLTGVPLHEVIRMASLTPARILGRDQDLGSLTVGKRADLVVLDEKLAVESVFLDGQRLRA